MSHITCHHSEFAVTGSPPEAKNMHMPDAPFRALTALPDRGDNAHIAQALGTAETLIGKDAFEEKLNAARWYLCACAVLVCMRGGCVHARLLCACAVLVCMRGACVHARCLCACAVLVCMRGPGKTCGCLKQIISVNHLLSSLCRLVVALNCEP